MGPERGLSRPLKPQLSPTKPRFAKSEPGVSAKDSLHPPPYPPYLKRVIIIRIPNYPNYHTPFPLAASPLLHVETTRLDQGRATHLTLGSTYDFGMEICCLVDGLL